MSVTPINRLAANSIKVTYDTRLQARVNIMDIYTMKTGTYNRENQSWPEDAIIMSVKDDKSTHQIITLKDPLTLPGVYGQNQAVGTEEDVNTRDLHVYQANYRKVINRPGYGTRYMEAEAYKLYDRHETDLTEWGKEEKGFKLRHGFLEQFSPNLVDPASDSSANCAVNWHPNIFIPTALPQQQPVYSANNATYTNNLVGSLIATGGLGQLATRILTATVCEDLSNWLLFKRIKRLKIPQVTTGSGFVVTVSELQAAMLSNPIFATNNLGNLWYARNRIPELIQKWPGVIGTYNDMVIVCDFRQPTIFGSGSSQPYSATAGYMVWGSRDLRNRDQVGIKDTCFVHGADSLIEVEGEKVHYISDEFDYKFHEGYGIAGVSGYQVPIYTDRTTGQIVSQGGALVILDLPNQGILSV